MKVKGGRKEGRKDGLTDVQTIKAFSCSCRQVKFPTIAPARFYFILLD